MKILIVEDVTLVAQRIESLCHRVIANVHCDLAFDTKIAESKLHQVDYDLVFLDINLNGTNGFCLLDDELTNPDNVIIITADQNHAVTAFEFEVFDFIHKPITQERFRKVIQRFLSRYPESTQVIELKKGNKHYKITLNDINYVKAAGNYSEIFTNDGKCHLTDWSISHFELRFDSFFRCHRSYLVKYQNIESLASLGAGQYRLLIKGEQRIPLSRLAYNSFNKRWVYTDKGN